MKRLALGLSVMALMVAGTGFAAPDSAPAPQPETRAEAQARAGRLFDKLDLNHDGKLDQADRAARTNAMFDRLDTNHDGMISRDEFAAGHVHGMGHGHDGPGHDGDDGHPGGGHDGRHMGHWGYGHRELRGLVMMILHRADPGHTGTVTRDAFISAALALFDQADTNHDGVLTPDEHRAAAAAARAHMAEHGGWKHHGDDGDGDGDGDRPPPPPASN